MTRLLTLTCAVGALVASLAVSSVDGYAVSFTSLPKAAATTAL